MFQRVVQPVPREKLSERTGFPGENLDLKTEISALPSGFERT